MKTSTQLYRALVAARMTRQGIDLLINDYAAQREVVLRTYLRGCFPRMRRLMVGYSTRLLAVVRRFYERTGIEPDEEVIAYAKRARERFQGDYLREVKLFEYPLSKKEADELPDDVSPLDIAMERMRKAGFAQADLRTLISLDAMDPFLKHCGTLTALGSPRRYRVRGRNVQDLILYAHERQGRESDPSGLYFYDVGENYQEGYLLVGFRDV